MQYAGYRHNRESLSRQEPDENVPRKQRPLQPDGPIAPLRFFRIKWEIVFNLMGIQVLNYPFLVIRSHVKNIPGLSVHASPRGGPARAMEKL